MVRGLEILTLKDYIQCIDSVLYLLFIINKNGVKK